MFAQIDLINRTVALTVVSPIARLTDVMAIVRPCDLVQTNH